MRRLKARRLMLEFQAVRSRFPMMEFDIVGDECGDSECESPLPLDWFINPRINKALGKRF